MDTSETFFQMCEKAQKILKHSLADEDYVIVTDGSQILYKGLLGFHKDPFLNPIPITITPLFTLDQLQEMVGGLAKLGDFWRWLSDFGLPPNVSSMEQLWLAFVMQERYNKVWSTEKEEWVSQSK